jgi:GNAT superfamily N-acetyltransferase
MAIKHHKINDYGKDYYMVFAEDESGTVIGSARLRIDTNENNEISGYLSYLHVDKSHQGRGFGTALQEYREAIIKELGGKEARLRADASSWVYRWYTSRGYQYHEVSSDGCDWLVKQI